MRKRQTKRAAMVGSQRAARTAATAADRLHDVAVDLVERLAVLQYGKQYGLSASVARACVAAVMMGDTAGDERAFGAILDAGQHQLSAELGVVPAALASWFDDGHMAPDAYPQLTHLQRIDNAVRAAA